MAGAGGRTATRCRVAACALLVIISGPWTFHSVPAVCSVAGRARRAPPVVIISAAVRRQPSGEKIIGKRVRLGQDVAEIVGVVGDIRRAGLTDQPRADLYFPFEYVLSGATTLFVRTLGEPTAALAPITSALKTLEPRVIVTETSTLSQIARESMSTTRLLLWLLGLFACVALALASIGACTVMSSAVRQRSREIGTRMALGAAEGDIVWSVMRQGLATTALGVGWDSRPRSRWGNR